jgi:ribosomal protein L21E
MKRLFISAAIVAGLVLGGVSAFADNTGMKQTETRENAKDMTQLTGKVTDIKGDSFMLKDDMGKTHKVIPAEPSELAKLNVGDHVTVDMRNGRAVSINKDEAVEGTSPNKEHQNQGTQNKGSNY